MIDIGGQSIIHRQLSAFRAVGVDDFVIVTGYEQDQLKAHLADQRGRFTYIENPRYGETNTVYSLYLAREHITDTFYYANADVLFDRRLTERVRTGRRTVWLFNDAAADGPTPQPTESLSAFHDGMWEHWFAMDSRSIPPSSARLTEISLPSSAYLTAFSTRLRTRMPACAEGATNGASSGRFLVT